MHADLERNAHHAKRGALLVFRVRGICGEWDEAAAVAVLLKDL
jgi:hypothetical protein